MQSSGWRTATVNLTKEQRDRRLQRRPVQSLSFTLGRLCKQTKGFGYLQAYLYAKAVQMFRVSRVHTLRHESFSYDRKRDRRKQLQGRELLLNNCECYFRAGKALFLLVSVRKSTQPRSWYHIRSVPPFLGVFRGVQSHIR